jgi:hypothetical protein
MTTTVAIAATLALGLLAGETGLGGFVRRGNAGKQTLEPTDDTAGLLGGLGGRRGLLRLAGCGLGLVVARIAVLTRLARFTLVARITRLALFTRVAGLAGLARVTAFTTFLRAAGVRSGVQHGHVAATHRAEDISFVTGTDGGSQRGGGGRNGLHRSGRARSGGSAVTFVREGGRFPALRGALEFGGGEDVEFGLFLDHGDRGRFDRGRDGRDRSGSGGFHLGNNSSDRRGSGGRFGRRSLVRRGERVLVFARRSHDLDGGGRVGCGVAGGGRRGGRRTDAFAARKTRTAGGAEGGTEVGGGSAGGLGGGP